jgi:MFS family permease
LTVLAPLRHRSFRLLFSAQLVSNLGDWLDYLALVGLLAYTWGLGPAQLAALAVAVAVPRAALAPLAGVASDRWPRKRIMLACDLARAVLVAGLIWTPNLYVTLALVAGRGAFSALFQPAQQASIATSVPADDLLAANSLSRLALQVTKVAGPVVGGALVALSGPRSAFAADAASFLLSFAFLVRLPALAMAAGGGAAPRPRLWASVREGLAYVASRRSLTIAMGSMSAVLFLTFCYDALFVLVLRSLGLGAALFGLMYGAIGLGTSVGASMVGQWGRQVPPLRLLALGQLASGVLVAVMGTAVLLHVRGGAIGLAPFGFLLGFAAATMFVPFSYLLQAGTPRHLLGRVSAAGNTVEMTTQLVAPPIGAATAQLWGLGSGLAVSGVLMVLVGVGTALAQPRAEPDAVAATP